MRRRSIIAVFLLTLTMGIRAQVLTLTNCIQLARDNYPSIAQYGLLDKIEGVTLSNVAKSWLPQGSINGQATWQNDVAALPSLLINIMEQQGIKYPGLDKIQYRIGLDVTQQIWDGGKTSVEKQAASSTADINRASLDLELYNIEGRIHEIYFSILLVKERITRTKHTLELVESTLQQIRSMHANGVATKSDCDQVEAYLIELQQQQIKLNSTNNTLTSILEIFIGEKVGNRILVLPAEDLQSENIHPQLRLFDLRLNNLTIQENGIKVSTMPVFGMFASGYYGYPGYNMFKNMQTHDPSFNFMIGVKATWNFGTLYTRKNSITKLQLQRNQIEVERNVFKFNNELAINESLNQISSLREMIKSDQRILELRRSILTASQSQLRNGMIDTTALLAKITDEELAENDLTLHNIELIKNIYNLNYLRNK